MNHGAALSINCSGEIMDFASRKPIARTKTSQVVSVVRTKTLEVMLCGILITEIKTGLVCMTCGLFAVGDENSLTEST